MIVRQRHTGWASVTAVSWRLWVQRFSFLFFLGMAVGALLLGKTHPILVENTRMHVVDTLAPLLDAVSRPLTLANNVVLQVTGYFQLHGENNKLREQNAQLIRWQNAALVLQNENKELKDLLHYKVEPPLSYVSARVIADTGGAFIRTLVVTAGKVDGVREGMAAMTGEGLIGRVVEVGNWSSRILMITDLSSRIPVTLTDSGDHAILAGDNQAQPKLFYLPPDANVKVGAHVVTSGHGGDFPPNLPVGVVTKASNESYEVTPLAMLGRINQVRLIDFNLMGGAFNPIANKIQDKPSQVPVTSELGE